MPRRLGPPLLVAAAYYLTGRLSLLLAIPPGYATAIWPPSGLALAAVLLLGPRIWPGIALGTLLLNLHPSGAAGLAGLGNALALPAVIAAGAAAQALAGGFLVRRLGGYPNGLSSFHQIAALLFLGGVVACLISASVGSAALWSVGAVPSEALARHWATWWVGDVIGVFVFTPLLLCAFSRQAGQRRRVVVAAFWLGCTVLATVVMVGFATRMERRALDSRFHRLAGAMGQSLEKTLTAQAEALRVFDAVYAGHPRRDRAEFTAIAARLRHLAPVLGSLAWAPVIAPAGLDAFEAWVRGQGQADYAVTQPRDGMWQPPFRLDRPLVPLTFLSAGAPGGLGHDLASDPGLAALLDEAARQRRLVFSPLMPLPHGYDGITLALPLDPGAAAGPSGYILADIRPQTLTHAAFEGLRTAAVRYWLLDDKDGKPRILSSNSADTPGFLTRDDPGLFGQSRSWGEDLPIAVGHRLWRLRVAPAPLFMADARYGIDWVVLFVGLLMSGAVSMLVLVSTGREQMLRTRITEAEARLRRHAHSLRLLGRLSAPEPARPDGRLDAMLDAALDEARRHLGMEQALLTRIEGPTVSVLQAQPAGSGLAGRHWPLAGSCCEAILHAADALRIDGTEAAGPPSGMPEVRRSIGAPVQVHGRLFGSLIFTTAQPAAAPADESDLDFVRQLARWVGVCLERDEAQAALSATHQRLATLLDNAPIGFAIISFQRLIVQANPAYCRIFGRPADQLIGKPSRLLYPSDESYHTLGRLALERLRDGQTFETEYPMQHGDGRIITVRLIARAVDHRKPDQDIVWAAEDITDRKASQFALGKALRELEEKAGALERSNSELEQFATVASHDLRQPLRQIGSYVGLLRKSQGQRLDDEGRQFLETVQDGVDRMHRLIQDLLDYARIGQAGLPAETVPVADILEQARRIMAPAVAEAGAELTLDLAEGVGAVRGNRIELERLVQNLLSNALTYRAADRPPRIVLSARHWDWGKVEILVADNGIGIAKEHHERVFGLFQRLHGRSTYEGTGIGLAVCKKIVDRHQGRIWLDSEPDAGTRVHIVLPMAETSR